MLCRVEITTKHTVTIEGDSFEDAEMRARKMVASMEAQCHHGEEVVLANVRYLVDLDGKKHWVTIS